MSRIDTGLPAKVDYDEFHRERNRLMHALSESIERGGALHQQLRGLKESLVANALRLYITNRIAEEDEALIDHLKQDAVESKAQSLEAEKKSSLAVEIVQDLTAEVKKLKCAVGETNYSTSYQSTTLGVERARMIAADEEMISEDDNRGYSNKAALSSSSHDPNHYRRTNSRSKVRPSSSPGQPISSGSRGISNYQKYEDETFILDGGLLLKKELNHFSRHQEHQHKQTDRHLTRHIVAEHLRIATPFQRWKIENMKWSPDTPAASEYCDERMYRESMCYEQDVADSFKDFNSLQKTARPRTGKSPRKIDTASCLPSVSERQVYKPPMSFESGKRMEGGLNPPPAVQTFLSKQQHSRSADKSKRESGKGPMFSRVSERVGSKLFH